MTEQTSQPQSSESKTSAPPARNNPVAGMLAHISFTQLALIALALIFLWQWLDGRRVISDMQQQLAAKISEMDGNSKANQILLAQNQEQVRELFAKVTALESHYAEAQSQRAALDALYNDLSASRDETALAEVEQLLLFATQQLQLSANVKAALIAMQSADIRLQRMNSAAFDPLRKAIGLDMDKLRILPNIDITGIDLQLNNLITVVDELPLPYQQRLANNMAGQAVQPKDELPWQKLLREIWQEIKKLVRIENTGKTDIPLLPPDQEFFLRENLKLRLLTARLALLSRDEKSFAQELKTAQLWTSRYFDAKSALAVRMSTELRNLSASSIKVELPDISPSLQAVRNYRLTHEHEPRGRVERRASKSKAQR